MGTTPCDFPDADGHYHCPYASYDENVSCRDLCGLGVDEDPYPEEDEESEVAYGIPSDT